MLENVYAEDQLRGWTDGPKIVFDFECAIKASKSYDLYANPDVEAFRTFAAGRVPSVATIFVKGLESEYMAVNDMFPSNNVIHLGPNRFA